MCSVFWMSVGVCCIAIQICSRTDSFSVLVDLVFAAHLAIWRAGDGLFQPHTLDVIVLCFEKVRRHFTHVPNVHVATTALTPDNIAPVCSRGSWLDENSAQVQSCQANAGRKAPFTLRDEIVGFPPAVFRVRIQPGNETLPIFLFLRVRVWFWRRQVLEQVWERWQ